MCWFKPNFIAAQEHSDEDLQALFDQLAKTAPVAGKLRSTQFRVNTSKPPAGASGGPVKVKKPTDYPALFTDEYKPSVDGKYNPDFTAFGYSQDLSCI